MDLGLRDAAAVVVGGGRGMGLAAARCLAEDGARIAVVGRTPAVGSDAATALTECGSPDAIGLTADITDAAQVQRVFGEIGERWNGELNILVNAVGPESVGTFEELTDEQWRGAFDGGVPGMVHCVRSALPLLPAYTAAKAALTSVSKNLSLLLAKDEITVNVVSPGPVRSGRPVRRNRARRGVSRITAQLVHDRCQRQRRRGQRFHLTAPETSSRR